MAKIYRDRVGQLIRCLADGDGQEEAKEALRALVEKIVLTPKLDGTGLSIDLHGALAGLLRLAPGQLLDRGAQAHARSANGKKSARADSQSFYMFGIFGCGGRI